jgi:hypothetical protein
MIELRVPPGFERAMAQIMKHERDDIDLQAKASLAPLISRILSLEVSVRELRGDLDALKAKSGAPRPVRPAPVRARR